MRQLYTLKIVRKNCSQIIVCNFDEASHREQATAEANAEFAIAGQPLPKKEKVYLDMAVIFHWMPKKLL